VKRSTSGASDTLAVQSTPMTRWMVSRAGLPVIRGANRPTRRRCSASCLPYGETMHEPGSVTRGCPALDRVLRPGSRPPCALVHGRLRRNGTGCNSLLGERHLTAAGGTPVALETPPGFDCLKDTLSTCVELCLHACVRLDSRPCSRPSLLHTLSRERSSFCSRRLGDPRPTHAPVAVRAGAVRNPERRLLAAMVRFASPDLRAEPSASVAGGPCQQGLINDRRGHRRSVSARTARTSPHQRFPSPPPETRPMRCARECLPR
jgi:hypothetical protein